MENNAQTNKTKSKDYNNGRYYSNNSNANLSANDLISKQRKEQNTYEKKMRPHIGGYLGEKLLRSRPYSHYMEGNQYIFKKDSYANAGGMQQFHKKWFIGYIKYADISHKFEVKFIVAIYVALQSYFKHAQFLIIFSFFS